LAGVPHPPYEHRGHLDEWSRKHVGEDQRPRSRQGIRPAPRQAQACVECVDACVLSSHAQRLVVDIDAKGSWYAQQQGSECEHARSCADVEHSVRTGDLHRFVERFETQRRGRVQSGPERRRVRHPEGAGLSLGIRRNDAKASDLNGAWTQDPDRAGIASHGRGDRDLVNAESARDLFWCNAVGHQGGDATIVPMLGVQRTELDEAIERIVTSVAKVDPVRHVPSHPTHA
jgi:hypothetical protein